MSVIRDDDAPVDVAVSLIALLLAVLVVWLTGKC